MSHRCCSFAARRLSKLRRTASTVPSASCTSFNSFYGSRLQHRSYSVISSSSIASTSPSHLSHSQEHFDSPFPTSLDFQRHLPVDAVPLLDPCSNPGKFRQKAKKESLSASEIIEYLYILAKRETEPLHISELLFLLRVVKAEHVNNDVAIALMGFLLVTARRPKKALELLTSISNSSDRNDPIPPFVYTVTLSYLPDDISQNHNQTITEICRHAESILTPREIPAAVINARMFACIRQRDYKQFDEATAMFKQHGITPIQRTYQLLIKSAFSRPDPPAAERIFASLEKKTIPDLATYRSLLSGFARVGFRRAHEKYLKKMAQHHPRWMTHPEILDTLLSAYIRSKQYEKANDICINYYGFRNLDLVMLLGDPLASSFETSSSSSSSMHFPIPYISATPSLAKPTTWTFSILITSLSMTNPAIGLRLFEYFKTLNIPASSGTASAVAKCYLHLEPASEYQTKAFEIVLSDLADHRSVQGVKIDPSDTIHAMPFNAIFPFILEWGTLEQQNRFLEKVSKVRLDFGIVMFQKTLLHLGKTGWMKSLVSLLTSEKDITYIGNLRERESMMRTLRIVDMFRKSHGINMKQFAMLLLQSFHQETEPSTEIVDLYPSEGESTIDEGISEEKSWDYQQEQDKEENRKILELANRQLHQIRKELASQMNHPDEVTVDALLKIKQKQGESATQLWTFLQSSTIAKGIAPSPHSITLILRVLMRDLDLQLIKLVIEQARAAGTIISNRHYYYVVACTNFLHGAEAGEQVVHFEMPRERIIPHMDIYLAQAAAWGSQGNEKMLERYLAQGFDHARTAAERSAFHMLSALSRSACCFQNRQWLRGQYTLRRGLEASMDAMEEMSQSQDDHREGQAFPAIVRQRHQTYILYAFRALKQRIIKTRQTLERPLLSADLDLDERKHLMSAWEMQEENEAFMEKGITQYLARVFDPRSYESGKSASFIDSNLFREILGGPGPKS